MSLSQDNIAMRRFSAPELRDAFSSIRWVHRGRVCRVVGTIVEAVMPGSQLGMIVEIAASGRSDRILAEIVGFKEERALLLPYTHLGGVAPGCIVTEIANFTKIPCGDYLLGRVLDPFMRALSGDELAPNGTIRYQDLDNPAPNPLERERISEPLSLGVRALDGLLTLGRGQRVGIMAGSGVGKSVLMGMIARNSDADINVIGLIGERGREVREFIEKDLGPEGLKRSVIVAVTSDQSPLMRIRGAKVATAIAEHFSAQGKNVLLMLDSLTRVAMAQREIGNAIGEPPTTKGYTPSVFSLLPQLLERTGPQAPGKGAISGLYTVLVDGDDFNEPVADAARSILDGHVVLSRDLAAKGHFPAIDVTASASRVMHDVVTKDHWTLAMRFKELMSVYLDNLDLVQIGAYQRGSNPKLDLALNLYPLMEQYLRQDIDEDSHYAESLLGLRNVLSGQSIRNTAS